MSEKPVSREQRRKALEQQKKTARKKPGPKKKKASSGTSWIKRIVLAIVLIGVVGLLSGLGLFAYYASGAPDLDEELLRDPISPKFLAADGKTEIPFMTVEDRTYVNYEEIPKEMEAAILATEDNRFYEHSGIDVIRLGGAVIANITGGFGSQGASTITQQVIKNSFLSNEKTLKRKAQEAYLAYKLEQEYTKEEIFEMYFNKILMSGNTYGFGTAAEHFYGKPLSELGLPEMALLAGMPQSPNNYNPFNHPEAAEKRRNIVLSLMEQHEKITTAQKEEAQAAPVTEMLLAEENRPKAPTGEYTAFMEMVQSELESLSGDYSLDEGLTIYTTLEPDVQKAVNETMSSDLFFDDKVESAMTIVDTQTGAIRAIGAGRDYSGDVRINYATSRDRVIGSTIKPLIAYGPAIEYLDWSTGQPIVDEPYSYEDGKQIRNVDGNFLGGMTIREALYRSRNIPAVKTLKEVGAEDAKDFVRKLGLDIEVFESTALGSDGISTVDLAGAFAAFGNDGIYTKPHTITKLVFRDGTTEEVVKPESIPAMKDSTAYMVTDMLRDVVDLNVPGATGKEAALSGLDLAGKTGTSNYSADDLAKYGLDSSSAPDVWFAGYTSKYSVSVWSGYPTREIGIDTASNERLLAQRLFTSAMSKISSSADTDNFKKPESVVELEIEAGSSPLRLASAFTPYNLRSTELFVRGTEPTQVSEQFVQEELDTPSGLRATVEGQTANLSWNYDNTEGVAFEVAVEVDGNSSVLTTTGDRAYSFSGLEEGKTYTFRVTAVSDDLRSDPASVAVEVAGAPEEEVEEEEPVEEEPVEEPEEPVETPEDENPDGNENGNNGNGNSNGNENNNGNGQNNGNGGNNGNGNGNNNGNGGNNGNGNGNGNGDVPPPPPEDDDGEGDANPASVPDATPPEENDQP
ncbi:penicillin-binding protein 1A [Planococcus sp. NCCP-2050]|uniref:penicillin-binding protein 1A n=1 Tax=Planococcus sp. NCCP-2050 TaxID=2944679 RepID=UPI0020417932|nr:penicillin-binding protein 1A [Planococcus sp. NCCP-2050]GKW44708.1 penicillin-binding protein 1A/1B [Planococcus sp. NCCP-2050]